MSKRQKLSSSTSSGDTEGPEEGEIAVEDYTVFFESILNALGRRERECRKIHREDVVPLAQLLAARGCRVHSALWIAIKFAGMYRMTPDAALMASSAGIPKKDLLRHEAEDLQRIDWDLAPLARLCGLLE